MYENIYELIIKWKLLNDLIPLAKKIVTNSTIRFNEEFKSLNKLFNGKIREKSNKKINIYSEFKDLIKKYEFLNDDEELLKKVKPYDGFKRDYEKFVQFFYELFYHKDQIKMNIVGKTIRSKYHWFDDSIVDFFSLHDIFMKNKQFPLQSTMLEKMCFIEFSGINDRVIVETSLNISSEKFGTIDFTNNSINKKQDLQDLISRNYVYDFIFNTKISDLTNKGIPYFKTLKYDGNKIEEFEFGVIERESIFNNSFLNFAKMNRNNYVHNIPTNFTNNPNHNFSGTSAYNEFTDEYIKQMIIFLYNLDFGKKIMLTNKEDLDSLSIKKR